MPYCVVDDLLLPFGLFTQSELEKLSSVEGEVPITLHADRIEVIIDERSEYINTHLRGRYAEIPVVNAPMLKSICRDLVSYKLASAKYRKNTDSKIIDNYNEALALLKDIQQGLIVVQDTDREIVTRGAVESPDKLYELEKF